MSFQEEVIARWLKNDNAVLWCCDSEFRVTAVNEWIKRHSLPIEPGKLLGDIFIGCAYELSLASNRLRMGLPFHSTKFELNFHKTTVDLFPLLDGDELVQILCCLEMEDGEQTAGFASTDSVLPIVSDRYRSPILNVLNILSALSTKFQADEDYKGLEYLNEAARSCYGMLRGVTEVRCYYQLVNRQADFRPKTLLLNDWLIGICQSLQVLLTSTQYRLEFTPSPEPLVIEADERLLGQAVFQLIANSCLYSPADSTIRVALSARGTTAHLTVSDEGIGIAQSDLQAVLEPFFSHRDTPVPEEEMGLGLGLPIAAKIAELHGGTLAITSEKNRGTTVALSLPVQHRDHLGPLELRSNATRYVTDRFSDIYIIFSDICKIKFY